MSSTLHVLPSPSADVFVGLGQALNRFIPTERLITDPLRLLAYGTDASLYRLVPKIVVKAESEEEVRQILACCRQFHAPITFRAAGTSLSGQAITDSVLLILGDSWTGIKVENGGQTIRLQPGVIGAHANRRLVPYSRKIGPDPASIDAAKIGGIAANNASGMCCGTHENSYQTLQSMRILLADGAMLDTGDQASRSAFQRSHSALLSKIDGLSKALKANGPLAEKVRQKYRIKNTTGYSLNALVDFEDPIDILQHLLIGSEGTLAFISEITYRTVVDLPKKASALVVFPDIGEACRTVPLLKKTPVAAVELLDSPAMRAVEDQPGMPKSIVGTPDGAAALLIETRAADEETLNANMAAICEVLNSASTLSPAIFSTDPRETAIYWNVRKGVFPAVAAQRPPGSTVIIEDVAFKIEDLAPGVLDLQDLFAKHGYVGCCIYGHALDGNMHFVIYHDFSIAAELERYAKFIDAVCDMVVKKYDGSLKAEHGTGRNMAPFVELEWGEAAYQLMVELKSLLDPENMLNPGVVLNDDPSIFVKNLKPMPTTSPLIDSCMECGFCEPQCPSNGLTFTPRQRIVGWREVNRLAKIGADPAVQADLRKHYAYDGTRTCAACGLCSTVCPMGINTGKLIKSLRTEDWSGTGKAVGSWTARHYGTMLALSGPGLAVVGAARSLIGDRAFDGLAGAVRKASGKRIPKVTHNVPTRVSYKPKNSVVTGKKVVYLPSCATRSMGPGGNDPVRESVPEVFQRLMEKAGFQVIYPENMGGLCCGQPWDTQGLKDIADTKAAELEAALFAASDGGKLPIVSDTSTCSYRMKEYLDGRLKLRDVIDFVHDEVLPKLKVVHKQGTIMLHLNCGAKKMGLEGKLVAIAKACAEKVIQPEGLTCCGFAGMWGFTTPELNEHATRHLAKQVPHDCHDGYSSNRTCEIGLADQAGIPYRSIVHLLAKATGV
ncbi:FAD-binding and (Fe-S)-binding domain-containing protein [Telmatospirillum sp.]|uniref:FAD-binding and (Fe-S)-binding domain-containing protein n=1 Tax=Telmatospirillum sp. TaxID=2079197 RepID=UPI00283B800C|nr:FAD-binding and (Fe-S)-binding domain-containing protein [Telmatospirillum sp.]MDR3440521.1 FAD-binding and (Fe-S)-binding domain-containing protein [Telmatospirillum sp.]